MGSGSKRITGSNSSLATIQKQRGLHETCLKQKILSIIKVYQYLRNLSEPARPDTFSWKAPVCFSQGSGFGVSGRGQEEERNAEEVEMSLMGNEPSHIVLQTMLCFSEFNELEKPKTLSQGNIKRRTKNIYEER